MSTLRKPDTFTTNAFSQKITPELERVILTWAGEGVSQHEISKRLLSEHGVKYPYQAVRKFLARTRDVRADTAKAVVREALAKRLLPDLDKLEQHVEILHEKALHAAAADERDFYLKAVEQLRKLIETRLRFSGAEQPDHTVEGLEAAELRIASRLDRIAAALSPGSGAQGDSADSG